ncbi:Sister chromatid cohesion 1 protein 1 [Bienertia sinuspersici]
MASYNARQKLIGGNSIKLTLSAFVEINSAWKVKPAVDPTVLPKRKNQAKFEAVTLPENHDADVGDVEQSIDYSNKFTSSATFQQTTYFAMFTCSSLFMKPSTSNLSHLENAMGLNWGI